MLDWVGEVVRLSYAIWPSYGGSFVVVALLVGLLFAPLTVRSTRSKRTLAGLQPEIQRINAEHAGNRTTRNEALAILYRNHNVAFGSIFLLVALQWTMLIVLYLLVRGFVNLDPNNGGGPSYLKPGTALWQSLKESGGQLTSFGIDLGRTMFTQGSPIGILVYTMLLIVLIVVATENLGIATKATLSQGIGVTIGALIAALIFPGAIVLYLITLTAFDASLNALTTERSRLRDWLHSVWLSPYREFRAQLREADRLDTMGSSETAATHRLSAIATFSSKSNADRLVNYVHEIHHNLVAASSQQPSGAIAVLAALNQRCPQSVSKDTTSSVVREWVRGARSSSFGEDLTRVETALTTIHLDLLEGLLDTCRKLSRDELSVAFCRGVTDYLWTHLDRTLRLNFSTGKQGLASHYSAFQLLDLIGPAHLRRAGQLCALGDLALNRDSHAEALARYDLAVKHGSQQAGERLAYHRAREGHRLLSDGKITSARRKFAEAWALHKDQEYALLDMITEFLSEDADTRVTLNRLETLHATGAAGTHVAFWRAIVHLRRGERDQATVLLRGFANRQSDGNHQWGPLEEGTVLLDILENDEQALIDWARRLVRTYGRQWTSAGPSDPWPLVGAVARHDRDLLAEMMALVGNPRELPEWVRTAGAHALLARSMGSARGGQVGAAANDAELAHRLLEG